MLTRPDRVEPSGLLRWPRFSVGRITLAMGACGLVLIVAVTALVAWREREVAFREARQAAQQASFSLADHASRLFEVADLALRTTTLALGDRSWSDGEASKPLWSEIRAAKEALPYFQSLLLADATGRLRLSTLEFPAPSLDLSDRAVFAATRNGGGRLAISDPVVNRITQRPTFLIARRLQDPDGTFRGMAAASVEINYFVDYWRRLDLPHDSHVALVRAPSGAILVRLPGVPLAAPTSIPSLRVAAAESPLTGRYRPAPDRYGVYHRLGDLPLYLTVSFSEAAVEREWRAWLWSLLVFPGLAILALVAILALARRQGRVEEQANRQVARARGELAAANGRLEQRVAERTADLRESNAEIQRFAYIVSHDLRAPLVNIMGFTSELQRLRSDIFPEGRHGSGSAAPTATALRDDFDEAISFIKTSIDKMDRLIKAILLLARQGTRVFEPEPVDMDALMRSIADGVAHRAQSASAEVTVGPMPPLMIDRIAAEQVFSNLVDNAVKYLRPGVPGTIAVTAEVEESRVAFRVADNGRGIDPRDHGRVFELFRRSGAQDRPGDGIGLAHVRTLVRQLGGTITLESAPGRGSTFTVLLPLEPSDGHPTP